MILILTETLNNMKTKLFSLCFLLLSTGAAFAQPDSLDIAEFKLPDIKRHQLDFTFDLDGEHHSDSYSNFAEGHSKQNLSEFSIDPAFKASYSFDFNSDRRQSSAFVNSDLNFSSTRRKDMNRITYRRLSYKGTAGFMNRYYFKSRFFLETNIYVSYYESNLNNKTEILSGDSTFNSSRYNYRTSHFKLPIKIGYGRIEPVSDAAHALYIYKALRESDRTTGNFESRDKIYKLAELSAELKNKRFFDERLRRIYELEAIDSFLTTEKLVKENDIQYYTALQDMWDYGGLYARYSGSRISLGFDPYYFNMKTSHENMSDTSSFYMITEEAALTAEYDWQKPVNFKWQQGLSADVMYVFREIQEGSTSSDTSNYKLPHLNIRLTEDLSYYPNTRTEFRAGIGGTFIQYTDRSNSENGIMGRNDTELHASFSLDGNYYISRRFRLSLNYEVYYDLLKAGSVSNWDYDSSLFDQFYSIGLIYSLI